MKKIYEKYLSTNFSRFNEATKKAFEKTAIAYQKWYGRFLPEDKKSEILDVGCGMGHFLYFLKKMGYINFIGVDISREQFDFVTKNITEKVIMMDIMDFLGSNEKKFKVIVANDIIEHIPRSQLTDFLDLIFNALDHGGVAFFKTENMSNPLGLKEHYNDITHESGFTENSLRQVLQIAGFNDVKTFPAHSPVFSFNQGIRMILTPVVEGMLKIIFKLYGYPVPSVLTKDLIAVAFKK